MKKIIKNMKSSKYFSVIVQIFFFISRYVLDISIIIYEINRNYNFKKKKLICIFLVLHLENYITETAKDELYKTITKLCSIFFIRILFKIIFIGHFKFHIFCIIFLCNFININFRYLKILYLFQIFFLKIIKLCDKDFHIFKINFHA